MLSAGLGMAWNRYVLSCCYCPHKKSRVYLHFFQVLVPFLREPVGFLLGHRRLSGLEQRRQIDLK